MRVVLPKKKKTQYPRPGLKPAVIKGVFRRSYHCYGNLLHHKTDINVLTNEWAGF